MLKALVFALVYALLAFIGNRLALSFYSDSGVQDDIFNSFLKFTPYGFMQGVLYLLICSHCAPKNPYPND